MRTKMVLCIAIAEEFKTRRICNSYDFLSSLLQNPLW